MIPLLSAVLKRINVRLKTAFRQKMITEIVKFVGRVGFRVLKNDNVLIQDTIITSKTAIVNIQKRL